MGASRTAVRRLLVVLLLLIVSVPVTAQSPPTPALPTPQPGQYSPLAILEAVALAYDADLGAMSADGLGGATLRRLAHQASKRLAAGLTAIVPHPCYLGLYGALWQRVGALRLLRAVWIAQPRTGTALLADDGITRILRVPLQAFDSTACPTEVLATPPRPQPLTPPGPLSPAPTPTPPTP